MAFRYIANQALEFCTNYMQLYPHLNQRIYNLEVENGVIGCILEGQYISHHLSNLEVSTIHKYVAKYREVTLILVG